ncbi:hypothetical protein QJQ45_001847 [Haematococcus lacustris]|nr:hypothetical protein QJQ45_001847 [Haematococcus lacustris]
MCWWQDQAALPAKGKEYPGLGYKRLRDRPPKAQQQQPATSDGYMVKMNLSPSIFHTRLLHDLVTWWEWYGKKTPVLQQVAQRVLSIPATSAGVERLFSVFKFIWSDRRNRLLMGRMWPMAYVYFNTRALKHQEQPMADDAADVARWEEWMASQPVEGAPLL